jgi:hypothetical protein
MVELDRQFTILGDRTWSTVYQVRGQAGVGVIDAFRVVVTLPELDRPHVRGDEDGGAQDRVQRGGEHRRNGGLNIVVEVK